MRQMSGAKSDRLTH